MAKGSKLPILLLSCLFRIRWHRKCHRNLFQQCSKFVSKWVLVSNPSQEQAIFNWLGSVRVLYGGGGGGAMAVYGKWQQTQSSHIWPRPAQLCTLLHYMCTLIFLDFKHFRRPPPFRTSESFPLGLTHWILLFTDFCYHKEHHVTR